ncbi:LytR/AlgR family response regulator transcription factor [Uliginosibacterium gangwonense]|uniref:LytR/AlgR family response regulator transcription factor n=1 Tax=Uliginosibacterium gangwonense TaxID=392736 RepID=UPI000361603B|nr:LytTR family DNA-binding domain-containing protein [Uliginosibacterium gangwonense]
MTPIRYLIAEDEPLLARALAAHLQEQWCEAECIGFAAHGDEALAMVDAHHPDVIFLDVRMPVRDGLQTAQVLCEYTQPPLIVFVTAYDEYALAAFEAAAVDYLLKPVEPERLARCIARLRERLTEPESSSLDQLALHLQGLLGQSSATERLRIIRAGVGNSVKMIPVEQVIYFEASDKYVNVVTPQTEALIRIPLRELLTGLDPQQFWQVHRGTIVNAACITSAERDENGRIHLSLQGRSEKLPVSRQFAHLFRQM